MINSIIKKELINLGEEIKTSEKELEALNDFETKQKQIIKQEEELKETLKNISIPHLMKRQKFNFVQRLFSSNYKRYLTEVAENRRNISEVTEKIESLQNRLESLKADEKEVDEKISQNESKKINLQLHISSITKSIHDLNNPDTGVVYLINKYDELCYNEEFMKEIISLKPSNIKYDKTNSETLYRIYASKKIDEINSKVSDNLGRRYFQKPFMEILQELNNPKTVDKDKYKIPHEYLFEEIRDTEDRQTYSPIYTIYDSQIASVLNIAVDENYKLSLKEPINFFHYSYFELDGSYNYEYGEKIEQLYTDKNNYLAIHGTNADSESINAVLENGLAYNRCEIGATTYFQKVNNNLDLTFKATLINFLSYTYKGNKNILLSFPRDAFDKDIPAKIWGKNEGDNDYYVLPKYILGYVDIVGDNRTFIKNTHLYEKNYNYLFYDYLNKSTQEVETKKTNNKN